MLTFSDTTHGRRSFLRAGGLALGGLALPDLMAAQKALSKSGLPITDKGVVFLFMHGGPPQTETFDPKMDAPSEVRSCTGEIKTTIPGVTFGGTMTKLAKQAHRMNVIRSFTTGDGNHDIKPIVGKATGAANLGSIYSKIAGMNRPDSGMPTNAILYPRAVHPDAQAEVTQFGKFDSTGTIGRAFAPFVGGGAGDFQKDLQLNLDPAHLDDRRALLGELDRIKRGLEGGGIDGLREQAYDVVLGGVSDAFDLSKEDPRTVAMYDTEPLMPVSKISKKWNNHKNYADHVRSLGKLMLLARRLCERGCGFVTVTTNFVWDFHADVNNATVDEGMGYVGDPFDHAVAAFLEDVHQRGLSDKILLVCCGEMGRTPKFNARGGRDHWGKLAPLILAGGGLPAGQVIGESTRDAGEPNGNAVTQEHLIQTVLHTLLDVSALRAKTGAGLPSEVSRVLGAGVPIPGLG